ncbi:MAG: polymer-forming cytoskeletal protein, partial [Elusimicrobia bacterium]|nr:polymer-forming cytoskeletal protein [Elusimicrobiota bacterium]
MNVKKLMLPAAALLLLSQALYARRPEVRHEDILVPKGETLRGDVATDRSLTVDGKLDGDATAVGGASVTINGELTGNLVSMGGVVTIPGLVDGDVSSIGGPVRVSGRVAGNVSAVGGGVALIGAGEVDGDISALGGGVQKDDGARHKGSVNSY